MSHIDVIFEKLDTDVPVMEIRREIASLISSHLKQMRESLGYWEKLHFLSAISALAWNRRSSPQPTSAWLRLSLVNIEKALVPKERRNENTVRKDSQMDALTFKHLIDALTDAMEYD